MSAWDLSRYRTECLLRFVGIMKRVTTLYLCGQLFSDRKIPSEIHLLM